MTRLMRGEGLAGDTHLCRTPRMVLCAVFVVCGGCSLPAKNPLDGAPGRALYEQKCRNEAGEKIYRRVENVEGILLLKVRPKAWDPQWSDPLWPGAAFALESTANEYIATFLGYEHAVGNADGSPGAITPLRRGYITPDRRPGGRPGYRYVDVVDEGDKKLSRYSGSVKIVGRQDTTALGVQMALKKDPNHDLNIYRWTLDKAVSPVPPARYGVTFEDHVVDRERALGIASSTVKVLDLQTGEVLGEMTRFAWVPNASRKMATMWINAYKCPGHAVGSNAATRKFVDQVLIPSAED